MIRWFGLIAALIVSLPCSVSAADLLTLGDLKVAVYDVLWTDSTDNEWSGPLVQRLINRAITDVQRECECDQNTSVLELAPEIYYYAAPDDAAYQGVLYAKLQKGNSDAKRELSSVQYEDPESFGSTEYSNILVFTIVDTLLQVKGTPDLYDTLYISFYRVTDDIENNADSVTIPKDFRPFIVDMVMAQVVGLRDGFMAGQQAYDLVAAKIRQKRDRRPQKRQTLGIPGL